MTLCLTFIMLKIKNLTFTCSVGSTKYGALLYCTKGRKQLSDIVFCLLLAEHTHEQLSVCRLEEKKKSVLLGDTVTKNGEPVKENSLATNTKNDKGTRLHHSIHHPKGKEVG